MDAGKKENVGRHFISGMCGGFVTTVVLHPLDLVKTRLQVYTVKDYNFLKNFAVVIKNTYKESGLRAFYQGISPAVLGSVMSWSIYFGVYENAKNRYRRRLGVSQLNGFYNMISSLEAGVIGSTITCPVWFLKTRLQLQNRLSLMPGYKPYKGIVDATIRICREEGVKTMYTGLIPSLLLTSHAAIQFVIYEKLKVIETNYRNRIDYKTGLWCGAVSKFCASMITYPLQVFRSRLQQLNAKSSYQNIVDCAVKIWKKEGIVGFYGGLLPNLIRVIPSSSLTLMTYEFVNSWLRDHHILD
ncbi:hypothetical protein WA538_001415 [Blastocystis sp. DL]